MNPERPPVPRPRGAAPPVLPQSTTPRERRLLRAAVTCPRCASRPAMRVTPALVEALAGTDPAARVATYQCHRRGCGALYDLTAAAFQDAS